ncbi:MAG: choline-binding transcriptional repressor BetI [Halocynthiibacter sp.]
MPKLGMEPIRRDALVKATIAEIGHCGTLDVTVSKIARRAGMSSALAHHYFGGKDQIFLAAMRHIVLSCGTYLRPLLRAAQSPYERVDAIVRASFDAENFQPDVISAWLNFYALAQNKPEARALLRIYHGRLHSNLVYALRPLVGEKCHDTADMIAALIDGLYLRQSLGAHMPSSDAAVDMIMGQFDVLIQSSLDVK